MAAPPARRGRGPLSVASEHDRPPLRDVRSCSEATRPRPVTPTALHARAVLAWCAGVPARRRTVSGRRDLRVPASAPSRPGTPCPAPSGPARKGPGLPYPQKSGMRATPASAPTPPRPEARGARPSPSLIGTGADSAGQRGHRPLRRCHRPAPEARGARPAPHRSCVPRAGSVQKIGQCGCQSLRGHHDRAVVEAREGAVFGGWHGGGQCLGGGVEARRALAAGQHERRRGDP